MGVSAGHYTKPKPIPPGQACLECGIRWRQGPKYCASCRRKVRNAEILAEAQLELDAQRDVVEAAAEIQRERRIITDGRGNVFEVVFDGT